MSDAARARHDARLPTRWIIRFVLGALFATCLIRVALIAGNWGLEDVDAYWDAAMRLRTGEALYPVGLNPNAYQVFRYAPWFAWLWVPLTLLPKAVAFVLWDAVLGAAAIALLVGLVRQRRPAAWALALLVTPWLLSLVQVGNIQPLLLAMLAFGVSRTSGPIWVALSASLKVVPILWLLVFVARRQWLMLAVAGGLTAILLAPMLLYDLRGYATDPGASYSLYYYVSPLAWAVAAVMATALAVFLAWRKSPFVWVAVAVAAMLAAPRSHVTYATFLLIGVLNGAGDRISTRRTDD